MNHKTFSFFFIVIFILVLCLSSTTSSRRLLDPSGSRIQTHPSKSGSARGATEQSPPAGRGGSTRGVLTYAALKRSPVCNQKKYGNCIGSTAP